MSISIKRPRHGISYRTLRNLLPAVPGHSAANCFALSLISRSSRCAPRPTLNVSDVVSPIFRTRTCLPARSLARYPCAIDQCRKRLRFSGSSLTKNLRSISRVCRIRPFSCVRRHAKRAGFAVEIFAHYRLTSEILWRSTFSHRSMLCRFEESARCAIDSFLLLRRCCRRLRRGRTLRGKKAIEDWIAKTLHKYTFHFKPLSIKDDPVESPSRRRE